VARPSLSFQKRAPRFEEGGACGRLKKVCPKPPKRTRILSMFRTCFPERGGSPSWCSPEMLREEFFPWSLRPRQMPKWFGREAPEKARLPVKRLGLLEGSFRLKLEALAWKRIVSCLPFWREASFLPPRKSRPKNVSSRARLLDLKSLKKFSFQLPGSPVVEGAPKKSPLFEGGETFSLAESACCRCQERRHFRGNELIGPKSS